MIASVISRLYLRNFRSYETLDSEFAPGLNLLFGPNGVGKTNVLEAVHVLISGKSPRTARDADMLRWGADQFLVKGLWQLEGRPHTLELLYQRDRGKRQRRDGQPLRRSEEISLPTVVYFAPDSLQLIKGGPTGRRAFLDTLLGQLFPAYNNNIARYNQALGQRNDLLKSIRAGQAPRELLPAWNETLIQEAVPVFERRQRLVERLLPHAAREMAQLAPDETMSLAYLPGLPEGGGPWEERLRQALEDHSKDELARGYTLFGPHRDDFLVELSGHDARVHASQGQQRSLALALILGQERLLAEETGQAPILLLDDIFSELDEGRRTRLLQLLKEDRQAMLTTTEADPLVRAFAHRGLKLMRVEKGAVHAE